jgi:hypothetical protein
MVVPPRGNDYRVLARLSALRGEILWGNFEKY